MKTRPTIGVLAYGSLIDDPGPEIGPATIETLRNIATPFRIEYARSSQSRGDAPTLVPVETGGAAVEAVIHVLRNDVTLKQAKDWVWRREVRKYGPDDLYREKAKPGKNSVVVGVCENLGGIDTVLYTAIGANISPLTADELARRAIVSARSEKVPAGRDGISYLIDNLRQGIETPLTDDYRREVLRQLNVPNLDAALDTLRPAKAPITNEKRAEIVEAFCEDCVWVRAIRSHHESLFESGETRHRLLKETANTFFHDLSVVFQEYLLLQMHKLVDVGSTAVGKDNLTSNYLLTLPWSDSTKSKLAAENILLAKFGALIEEARRKLLAHTDVRARLSETAMGSFMPEDEATFWMTLQRFIDLMHDEAVGGPFEITAAMPDGDAASLLHRLADAVDYDDLVNEQSDLLVQRVAKRRFVDL